MKAKIVRLDELNLKHLQDAPVWEYLRQAPPELIRNADDLIVQAVTEYPVTSLSNRLIGTSGILANGDVLPIILDNIHLDDVIRTKMFRTVTITRNGKWMTLARFHDAFYRMRNEDVLAKFIGLKKNQVFPISYNISSWCRGDANVLVDVIPIKSPASEMSVESWSRLAVPERR